MNKVVTIHLDGIAYSLEEKAFDALRAYLDAAERSLANNPDKEEIIKDLEQAIGVKLSTYLTAHKNVVTFADVEVVIAEMGPVAEVDAAGSESKNESTKEEHKGFWPNKRLYRLNEGRWIAGVCNGLAEYFNVDVTLVRILFVVTTIFFHGLGGLVYLILMFVVPVARTPKEFASATGVPPVTAQELVDRARKGIEDFTKSGEWTYWKNNWKQESNAWKAQHKAWKHEGRVWQNMHKHQVKAEMRRMRQVQPHSVVSEIFGIACATLAITFTLWFLYGHVALVHDFFNALHQAYKSFIYSLATLIDSANK